MSLSLINLSCDLKRLRDEGYEIVVISNYVVVKSVPYVNASKTILYADLISELTLAGDRTTKPGNHTMFFTGEHPCNLNGEPLKGLVNSSNQQQLADDLLSKHMFSSKPREGYMDYYQKFTTYINILQSQAQAIDVDVTAKTFKVIDVDGEDSVFKYLDTASSRANIMSLSAAFKDQKIGIIGLGGSGAYILDYVAKTPVAEIHLFDQDIMLSHNAFRTPGAATLTQLKQQISKVRYLKAIYSEMHKHIIAHEVYIDQTNTQLLNELNFIFLTLDDSEYKKEIIDYLNDLKISFIDVGIGIYYENGSLGGHVRATTGTESKQDHLVNRISFAMHQGPNEYAENIQIAELNSMSACMAVIKWKKLLGIYHDDIKEHNSIYTIGGNNLINEDR